MKKLAIIITLISLSACSHKATKECIMGQGADCKSVSEVNEMVNKKELPRKTESEKPAPVGELKINKNTNTEQGGVSRTGEKTARIWVNGFEDEQGDYIEEGYVHVVLRGGQWRYAK